MTAKYLSTMAAIFCYHFLIIFNVIDAGLTCSTEPHNNVLCVSNNNHRLCHDYNASEYHTLAYYMNHSSEYFKSFETYIFQPGKHTPLNTSTLNFTNVTNLTLIGLNDEASAAIVDCNGRFTAFEFTYFSNITIKHLTFSGCIRKRDNTNNRLATLAFIDGTHLSLLGVTLFKSVDESFYINNILGDVMLSNLMITNGNMARTQRRSAGNQIVYRSCEKLNYFKLSRLSITDSKFSNNSLYFDKNSNSTLHLHSSSLTIYLECSNITVKIDNVTMSNNNGNTGGNIAIIFRTNQTNFNRSVEIFNSVFEGGCAPKGGGMYAEFIGGSQSASKVASCWVNPQYHRLLHVYNTAFVNNVAEAEGSGVYLRQEQSLTLCSREEITFTNVTFRNNSIMKVGFGGIAIHSIKFMVTDYLYDRYPQYFVTLDNCEIYDNYVISQVEDSSGTGVIFTKSNHYFLLNNSAVFNNSVTGIIGMSSNIILSRNITIVNNTGSSGGGLFLCQNAVMYFDAYTNVTITHNTANHTGGGICVDTVYLELKPICFFQLGTDPQRNQSLIKTINIMVSNNHAGYAGHNIFGGSIDYCYILDSPPHRAFHSSKLYHALFTVPNNTEYISSVTSPPRRVCPCYNQKPNCNHHQKLQIFPGETFSIEAVLVGQYNGTVPGTVQASVHHKNSRFGEREGIQTTKLSCTNLRYTIYTDQSHELLELKAKYSGEISGFERSRFNNQYNISISMKECPLGFTRTLKSVNNSIYCDCDQLFSCHKDHISCDIEKQVVRRVPPAWIGYIETDKGSKITAYHSHCPEDYCVNTDVDLDATNSSLSQDKQCAFNRTGILCGSCSVGLSNILGSSECHPCSNVWLLLNIPFAFAGILLVLVLTLFNITVSEGTLSGIIFYCNIIENNVSIFFPGREIFVTRLLKMFLSLTNLEIELSLCLFNGMDGYIKAWLKFGFPLYLWFITAVFIFLSGKRRCSWIVRQNAVKVLATLILLSYACLLTAVTKALQVSYLHLNNGNYERRWMIDGNVQYFTGKHIPLFLFASFFSLLLLPLSLCLLFIQCLQKVSHFKAFSWVNYFKPIFDAYTGPFRSSARFWTGLLLLLRGILFVVSASDTSGDPGIILWPIVLTVLMLLAIVWILPSGLYRRKCLSVLECSSLLNLGVLTSLLLVTKSDPISSILTHISVSIAFFTFIGIIVYHISSLQPVQKLVHVCCDKYRMETGISALLTDKDNVDTTTFPHFEPYNEDREPLLANN